MSAINLALNRPAYSSSSVLPYTAGRAVNGTLAPTSRWLCCNLPGWICVDLGAAYRVNRWVVRNMSTAGWASPDYNMVDFKLQVSNSITSERDMGNNALWADVDVVTNNSLPIVDRTLASIITYRYFRMYVSKGIRCNTQLASAMELEIYKAPDSSKLTNLVLNNTAQQCIVMQPTFNMNTTAYTATVPYDTASVTLTPTAEQGNAIIKVNGVAATNGQPSAPVSLNVGSNAIPVQVTAGDGTSQTTYTVTVTRQANPIYLTNLVLGNGASFETPFTSQTLSYNVNVPYDAATFTITPSSSNASATITINGTTVASGSAYTATSPAAGTAGTFTVVISAPGNSPSTYTLNAIRASNNYLSTLTITPPQFRLNPNPFASTNLNYTASTAFASINITPVAEDPNAEISVTVNNVPVTGGYPMTINFPTAGTYTIKITVSSAYGNDKSIYTIVVSKN